MTLEQLKSAIYNDVMGGLRGITSNPNISMEQLEDDIIDERLIILKEYSAKNMIPVKDLLMSVNCLETDCQSLNKCPHGEKLSLDKPILHVQIPQILNDYGEDSIDFMGSPNKEIQFKIYTSTAFQYHKFLRRGGDKPFVYIDTVPNYNNMYDAYIFNAPFMKRISVVAIFKDPRQLQQFDCCNFDDINNFNFIDNEIKRRVTEKKVRYYRQMIGAVTPNDQTPK